MELPDSESFMMALLLSARGEMSSSMVGSHASKRTPTLAWEQLVELYGDEESLRERVNAFAAATSNDGSGVIGLARVYAEGSWHEDFEE